MSSHALWIGLLKVGLEKSRKEINWVRHDQRTRMETFHLKWPELKGPRKRLSRLYVDEVQRNKKLMCNLKKIKFMKLVDLRKAKNYGKAFLSGTLPCPQLDGFKTGWVTFLQRCFLVDYCQPGGLALYFIKLMLWQNSDTMCHQMMLISFILCVHFIII